MYDWKRKGDGGLIKEVTRDGVTWLSFPALEETGLVAHAFSTRMGGVSKGCYSTMNFSFTRGDDPEAVRENYRRMAKALDVDETRMVLTWQTHTINVRTVTPEDEGKGIVKERDYRDVDGLITDRPGVTLVTFFADCVPLYFLDRKRRAIGLAHSGWRGTVNRMGQAVLSAMEKEYGTDPADVTACIGPSNRIVFREAGVSETGISVTDICTHCNPELLFSHRTAADRRGNLCAFLCLKEEGR